MQRSVSLAVALSLATTCLSAQTIHSRGGFTLPPPPDAQDGGGFGKALATVLRDRPCRVIVESPPRPEAMRPSVAA